MRRKIKGREDYQVAVGEGSSGEGYIHCLVNQSIIAIVSFDGDGGRHGGGSRGADHLEEEVKLSSCCHVSNVHDINSGASRSQLAPNSFSIISWSCGDNFTVSRAESIDVIDVDIDVSWARSGDKRIDGGPGDVVIVIFIGVESADSLVGMEAIV